MVSTYLIEHALAGVEAVQEAALLRRPVAGMV